MWSFWSRGGKDLPYDIGDIVPGVDDVSIWVLHEGKKKSTQEPVSIFRHEVKPGREDAFEKAKASVKRLKTLRHPNIMTYIDSLETEKFVCVVTEHVQPLDKYIQNSNFTSEQKRLAISWGLYQVSKGLSFLVNDCNLNHNNIFMGSIYVNDSANWKIGGLDYVTSVGGPIPPKYVPNLDKYLPPDTGSRGTNWSNDSWGLACLLHEVFNGQLPQAQALKSPGKIPKPLIAIYNEMTSNNPSRRPSPQEFIEKGRANGIFKNSFVDAMLFLEEIQIKEAREKSTFFTSLDSQLDTFPRDICRNKILPQLVTAFEYGNAGSAILGPLFKIGKQLDDEEYKVKIVPCIVKLFSSKDRATRAKLLTQVEFFIKHLSKNIVNDQIYPQIAQGFIDSNPTIREHTVKCMLHLGSRLNYQNLNEDVLKHFARLQARDEEGGIRTNTTVCLGKIAPHLNPQIRQTVLIPAFLRSMRDPFAPARIAGILALSATQNFYSLRDTSTKVMSALCHLTIDPDKSVREHAFKALKGFISKVEKVSEDPSLAAQMEADLNAAGTEASTATASWAGWAVSSLTSKFYRPKTPTLSESDKKASVSDDKAEKDVTQNSSKTIRESDEEEEDPSVWGNIEDKNEKPASDWNDDANGWDSFDVDPADIQEPGKPRRVSVSEESTGSRSNKSNKPKSKDDELWDALSDGRADKVPVEPIDDSMQLSGMKQRPIERKPTENESSANKVKPARKGPLKLGAQKIS
ncbi:putative inactive serine/threonine-protein kinase scy1 [Halotydeus destructor]|nr:putative inactive serine/threonine-protein kinase scy1 [Halotydeus destructor]